MYKMNLSFRLTDGSEFKLSPTVQWNNPEELLGMSDA